ncbi:hypothetical protein D3C86_1724550 [compost metagenome]
MIQPLTILCQSLIFNRCDLPILNHTQAPYLLIRVADALQVNPTGFFGLVIAASQHQPPREVMLSAIAEMKALGLADIVLPAGPQKIEAPVLAEARERKDQASD